MTWIMFVNTFEDLREDEEPLLIKRGAALSGAARRLDIPMLRDKGAVV